MKNKVSIKTDALIAWYTQAHLTLRQIAKLAGMSHTGVMKRLKTAGITARDGTWVKLICNFCGEKVNRPRCQAKHNRVYCCEDHYFADLENPDYKPWRQGQRLAHAIVGQHCHISPDNVVHHEDGDNRNNNRNNLKLFLNQSEHMKYHRASPGKKPLPIWSGA